MTDAELILQINRDNRTVSAIYSRLCDQMIGREVQLQTESAGKYNGRRGIIDAVAALGSEWKFLVMLTYDDGRMRSVTRGDRVIVTPDYLNSDTDTRCYRSADEFVFTGTRYRLP